MSSLLAAALLAVATPPGMPALGFDEAVARALAANPSMAIAAQSVARADALLAQARAGYFPLLTANAVLTHLDDERSFVSGGTKRVVAGQEQQAANLQLTVPLLAPQAVSQSARARDA